MSDPGSAPDSDAALAEEPPPEPEPVEGLRLQATGDDHDRAEWERAAAAVLRKSGRLREDDADERVWELLTRTTLDGIEVAPVATADAVIDVRTSGRPQRQGPWDVRVPSEGDAERAVAELALGATSLWLAAPGVDVAAALDGVRLDSVPVVLDSATADQAEALVALGALHPDTNLGAVDEDDAVRFAGIARTAGVRAVVVDGTTVHEQGATDALELGWVLAHGVRLLRALEAAGIERPFDLVELRVAATDEQFPTIAKIRALRRLWSRVAELSDAAPVTTRIHAVTSRPMTSKYDVHTNILRATVAAFAAGVGGADALTVVPFDEPTGESSELGRRIARNTSALLVEESHVAAVADPAGGSYAVERLTDDLAVAAWAELGRIETDGFEAFDTRVREAADRRARDIATRRRPITGLTEFPHADDAPAPVADASMRWGSDFEALRDDPGGAVWLVPMGTVADHTARASFATNLLVAGGLDVVNPGPFADADAAVAAYDDTPVVCLVGSDAAYAEWGAEVVAALREAGARHVILAGTPGDRTLPEDLVDDSCARGVDALAFLRRTRDAAR